jgi:hypothetical protein
LAKKADINLQTITNTKKSCQIFRVFDTFIYQGVKCYHKTKIKSLSISQLNTCSGVHFKFILKAGIKESIVNAPRITDNLFKTNLTFCVVCVFSLQTEEWCVQNRLFNANSEEKMFITPEINASQLFTHEAYV